jgi:hypothetical protein
MQRPKRTMLIAFGSPQEHPKALDLDNGEDGRAWLREAEQAQTARKGHRAYTRRDPRTGKIEQVGAKDPPVEDPYSSALRGHVEDPKLARHARRMVEGWRDNVYTDPGLEFRAALAHHFGYDVSKDWQRLAGRIKKANELEDDKAALRHARKVSTRAKAEDKVKAAIGVVSASQAAHQDSESVTLYRGIWGKYAEQIRDAAARGETVQLQSDTLASYTESHATAHSFAKMFRGSFGLVIRVTVPRQAIAMSHRVLPALRKQQEVVVRTTGTVAVDPKDVLMYNPKLVVKALPQPQEEEPQKAKPAIGAGQKVAGAGGKTRYNYPDEAMKKRNKRAATAGPADAEDPEQPEPEEGSPNHQDPEGGPQQVQDPVQVPHQPTEKTVDPNDLANQLKMPLFTLRSMAKRFKEEKKLKGRDGFITFMNSRCKALVAKHKLDRDYFGLVYDALLKAPAGADLAKALKMPPKAKAKPKILVVPKTKPAKKPAKAKAASKPPPASKAPAAKSKKTPAKKPLITSPAKQAAAVAAAPAKKGSSLKAKLAPKPGAPGSKTNPKRARTDQYPSLPPLPGGSQWSHSPGLVKVQRMVQNKMTGHYYWQSFWVRPEDAKKHGGALKSGQDELLEWKDKADQLNQKDAHYSHKWTKQQFDDHLDEVLRATEEYAAWYSDTPEDDGDMPEYLPELQDALYHAAGHKHFDAAQAVNLLTGDVKYWLNSSTTKRALETIIDAGSAHNANIAYAGIAGLPQIHHALYRVIDPGEPDVAPNNPRMEQYERVIKRAGNGEDSISHLDDEHMVGIVANMTGQDQTRFASNAPAVSHELINAALQAGPYSGQIKSPEEFLVKVIVDSDCGPSTALRIVKDAGEISRDMREMTLAGVVGDNWGTIPQMWIHREPSEEEDYQELFEHLYEKQPKDAGLRGAVVSSNLLERLQANLEVAQHQGEYGDLREALKWIDRFQASKRKKYSGRWDL